MTDNTEEALFAEYKLFFNECYSKDYTISDAIIDLCTMVPLLSIKNESGRKTDTINKCVVICGLIYWINDCMDEFFQTINKIDNKSVTVLDKYLENVIGNNFDSHYWIMSMLHCRSIELRTKTNTDDILFGLLDSLLKYIASNDGVNLNKSLVIIL